MVASCPSDIFKTGDLLNSTYRIEAIIGRGGLSEVYRARSEISGRVVAIKVLSSQFSSNEDYLLLMKREEEIRDVRHDAVVRYSENNRTPDGHVYLTMDYIDGPSLEDIINNGGMPVEDVMAVARRVAEGLVATHARNIVHRDLSPDNILLRDKDPVQAVIIDFGIARDTNPGAATIVGNEFAGKYAYAPPEQLNGTTDARSDIYSLGAVLLATFRGQKPGVGKNPIEVIESKSQPLNLDGVPQPLANLIERMTAPDPDARFQSAQDILEAIDPGSAGTIIGAPRSSVAPPPPTGPAPAISRTGVFAVIGVVLAALVGAGAYFSGALGDLMGPNLPVADPYVLTAEGGRKRPLLLSGNVPSEDMQAALSARASAAGGQSDLTLATGTIADGWPLAVEELIARAGALDEWALLVRGNTFTLSGVAADEAARSTFLAAIESGETFSDLTVNTDIAVLAVPLSTEVVASILLRHADCGPLDQANEPPGGYGPDAPIIVRGAFALDASRDALFQSLTEVAENRRVLIEAAVRSPEACLLDTVLAAFDPGGLEIVFKKGGSGDLVPTGEFRPGQNPVITVDVPDAVDRGHIWISVIDLDGEVFHLLPNQQRLDNSVTRLSEIGGRPLSIPVTYTVAEADGDPAKIAFQIDDRPGTSRVLVMHSVTEFFAEPRPFSESVSAFSEAMIEGLSQGEIRLQSVAIKPLITVQ